MATSKVKFGRWLAVIALALAVGSQGAEGATIKWNSTGTDWATGANWVGGTAPANDTTTDTAQFAPTVAFSTLNNPNLGGNRSVANLNIGNNYNGGGWTFTGTGNTLTLSSTGSLTTRGSGTYTLNGPNINGSTGATVNIGAGSTLALTGASAATGIGTLNVQSGTLLVDNSAGGTAPQFTMNAAASAINVVGGSLVFNGASVGSAFSVNGALSATGTVKVGGATGVTSVNFGSLLRADTAFVNSGSGTLGGGGANDPKITFTTAPVPVNGTISIIGLTGFTIVSSPDGNNANFANYGANGIVAATTTPVNGTLSTSVPAQNSNLNGSASIGNAVSIAYNTLVINPSATAQSLNLNTSGVLSNTLGVMLAGATDYSVTGGSINDGGNTNYWWVTNPATTLSIGSTLVTGAFAKGGSGTVAFTSGAGQFQTNGNQIIVVDGGAVRVNPANLPSATTATAGVPFVVAIGGVLEYDVTSTNFTFKSPLTGPFTSNAINSGTFSWTGSGGFSAYSTSGSNALTVNLGGSSAQEIWASSTGFVSDGQALMFGSIKSTNTVIWQNPIALDSGSPATYNARNISVTQGTGGANDLTKMTGAVTGSSSTDLMKTGTGVLVLVSAGDTYAGQTLVQGGTLFVNNTHTGGGNYLVSGGGTLGGTGTISLAGSSGVIALGASPSSLAIISPGSPITSATGNLTVGGNVVFGTNSEFAIHIGAGSNSELTILGSTASAALGSGNATLLLTDSTVLSLGTILTILDATGSSGAGVSGSITGTFFGHAEGTTFSDGTNTFRINYGTLVGAGLGSGTLTLTVVPEPGSLVLFASGALGAMFVVRRRAGIRSR